ncbi:MAG: hypothetical protein DIZ77_08010 [endosymbiont of Seepiophila jonesi]|uniref:Pvc16 N-terminal domain-containing protein n=1 Tax=endosymbiont of Lamellibrachia luymesi TaxID=2200907 RepID=A0A370E071_9GAMM|nr:MAG: hypothetical protein DIZ79_05035 [endosymbiont of Lamellibrachia luymesi]RDH92580.1 MAG: hypothetical protein DIZ77_08010 [endosymbiont of Seepiophila jonesi]
MIKTALELLVTQLNLHLGDAGSKPATLGNIAQLENQDSLPTEASIKDKVVLSLVNLEEEKTMKNGPIHKLHNGRKELAERPVHLNMFLLFSANLTHYDLALERLSQILLFSSPIAASISIATINRKNSYPRRSIFNSTCILSVFRRSTICGAASAANRCHS